uniref:Restriction endonuclease n=1 Tax=viral metagenome TaxID=1070528 RepID=A0A6C0KRT9_9ZZZZ
MTLFLYERFCRILDTEKHLYPLLANKEIFNWILGDLSFLSKYSKDKLKSKEAENEWGKNMLQSYRPQYKADQRKQWTNEFGEDICLEYLRLMGKEDIQMQKLKDGSKPDFLTRHEIWEVKTGTYLTPGTAHDKIASVPFIYGDTLQKFDKRALFILCVGGAEKYCRVKLGIFPGPKQTPFKKAEIESWKQKNIYFISLKDNLVSFINDKSFVLE